MKANPLHVIILMVAALGWVAVVLSNDWPSYASALGAAGISLIYIALTWPRTKK